MAQPKPSRQVLETIAAADTPEKVWALVASLASDGNGYSPETYLKNVQAYATIAQEMHA